ncbi:MAG: amidohydrolase family protein [Candidatus Koribacter versatilis]|uniref:Amidohydrolase family protein n=1 Tax=Candidatus Korobacter versatilis TaxID=658062 RepID=A0A932EQA9_9BACT|nr:amidohydrolase family protein [Candidatus Koribacter versatilis]
MKKLVLIALLLASVCAVGQTPQYDVLIRNGKVVDGSGNPWFYADLGIIGDRIAFIGRAGADVTAKRTIDAKGLVVAPGFIDMLGQSETGVLIDKTVFSKITQGITTEITGEGESIAPQNDFTINEGKDFLEHFKLTVDWRTLADYFKRLEKQGSAVNIGTFVGATQVREVVLGKENRPPTGEELKQMVEYVEDAMYDGALGLSTSLIYAPANYANTEELIALAKAASKHGGIYSSHIRNEGDTELQALDEAFRIGREANIPVEIWHFKVSGRQNWGKMRQVIAKVEQARAEGLDVTADQYPYVASATSLGATIPPSFHAGGEEQFVKRLQDPAVRKQVRDELMGPGNKIENMWRGTGGPAGILVTSVLNPELKKYEGQTVAQIAKDQNKDPLDALIDFVIADRDNTGAVYFSMAEEDVRLAMQQPWVAVDTDYGGVNVTGPLSESKSHPRAWGAFPRILGKYVREEHVLRLEDAIRKMTSLAAQRVKLRNRGLLKQDYFADVTIFDPENVIDVATFEDPNRPAKGIEYVLVNGVLTLERGKLTGQFGGRPLRGPGYNGPDEGAPPRGKIQGVVTDEGGWPLGRTMVSVVDSAGKVVAQMQTRYLGRYEIPLEQPCDRCKVRATRDGFDQQERAADYNGANSLWFSFALKRLQVRDADLNRP